MKQCLVFLLVFTLLASLFGCGSQQNNPTVNTDPTVTEPTKATEPAVSEPQPENPTEAETEMVAVSELFPELFFELKYAAETNPTGRVIYGFDTPWLRRGTVEKLRKAAAELEKQGLYLKLWDSFRPVSAQNLLFAIAPELAAEAFTQGGTVAVTLTDAEGNELEMPSQFGDCTKAADRDYSDCSPTAAKNARLLEATMRNYGFFGNSPFWWQYTDAAAYPTEVCLDPGLNSLWYADSDNSISLTDAKGTVLGSIPSGSTFTLLGWKEGSAYVSHNGLSGFIPADSLRPVTERLDITEWTPNCNEYINFYDGFGGNLLGTIPVGAKLTLVEWFEKRAVVNYNGQEGYVASQYIKPDQTDYFDRRLSVVSPTAEYSYQQMLEDMQTLQARYPHLISIDTIGTSEQGRNIPVMVVGNPDAPRHILVQGAIHAREHMTAWLAMAVTDHSLAQNYFSSGLVCYHIIPMSNPDGVTISQNKTLNAIQQTIYGNDLAAGYTAYNQVVYAEQWKANALGIDLNRNFPAGWENAYGRENPSAQGHMGSAPFCAAESAALRDYTLTHDFDVTISLHAYGSVLYYLFGNRQPVNSLSESLAKAIGNETGYILIADDGTSGTGYKDWVMDELGIPSVTIEIGCVAPPLAERELYPIFARFQNIIPILNNWVLKH